MRELHRPLASQFLQLLLACEATATAIGFCSPLFVPGDLLTSSLNFLRIRVIAEAHRPMRTVDVCEVRCWTCHRTVELPANAAAHRCPSCDTKLEIEWRAPERETAGS
jgi:DNA-directed RNA polymerase subunit RPC12/RpoP